MGAVGNTDDNRCGRGLGKGGKPSKDGTKLSGKQNDPKTVKDSDYEGHRIGKRHKDE